MKLLVLFALLWACSPTPQPSSTPPPQVEQPAPEPPRAPPTAEDAFCTLPTDCAWDNDCFPRACVGAKQGDAPIPCDKALPPPGECHCIQDKCTLKLKQTPPAAGKCETVADCSLDRAHGSCTDGEGSTVRFVEDAGPYCDCKNSQCTTQWLEPVECTDSSECGLSREPVLHPILSDPPQKGEFKPCHDGEIESQCRKESGQSKGTCSLVFYRC